MQENMSQVILCIYLSGRIKDYMLHAMTKPALMTFSHFEAINFYFNAKLTLLLNYKRYQQEICRLIDLIEYKCIAQEP